MIIIHQLIDLWFIFDDFGKNQCYYDAGECCNYCIAPGHLESLRAVLVHPAADKCVHEQVGSISYCRCDAGNTAAHLRCNACILVYCEVLASYCIDEYQSADEVCYNCCYKSGLDRQNDEQSEGACQQGASDNDDLDP